MTLGQEKPDRWAWGSHFIAEITRGRIVEKYVILIMCE